MSKKSRRRNKKILAALALAGGAAMFGRRKKNALGDTGSLSGKAGFEGMDYLAPTKKTVVLKQNKKPDVLKQDKKLNVLKQDKKLNVLKQDKKPDGGTTPLYGKNITANQNAIPHEVVFNARHRNPIGGSTFGKNPGFINVKKEMKVLEDSGAPKKESRNKLFEFMAQEDKKNWLIRQDALNNARTDYSASGFKRGGRITLKSGGRVRGVGIAKRGFSKSLRKK